MSYQCRAGRQKPGLPLLKMSRRPARGLLHYWLGILEVLRRKSNTPAEAMKSGPQFGRLGQMELVAQPTEGTQDSSKTKVFLLSSKVCCWRNPEQPAECRTGAQIHARYRSIPIRRK